MKLPYSQQSQAEPTLSVLCVCHALGPPSRADNLEGRQEQLDRERGVGPGPVCPTPSWGWPHPSEE